MRILPLAFLLFLSGCAGFSPPANTDGTPMTPAQQNLYYAQTACKAVIADEPAVKQLIADGDLNPSAVPTVQAGLSTIDSVCPGILAGTLPAADPQSLILEINGIGAQLAVAILDGHKHRMARLARHA